MRTSVVTGAALAGVLVLVLAACDGAAPESAAPALAASGKAGPSEPVEDAKEQLSWKRLGPAERRVKVRVLPVDAQIEVDGAPMRRRDGGVIELVGNVGATHKLRVFKGAQSEVKVVTLQATGADPSLIDLDAGDHRKKPVVQALDVKVAAGLRYKETFDEEAP